jgi:hypothetical protein
MVDKRKEIAAKHPEKKMTELTTIISQAWKAESEANKAKYEKLAVAAKEKYAKEKAAYKPPAKDSSDDESESEEESDSSEKPKKRGKGKAAKKGSGKKSKKESSSEEESD